MAHVMLETCFPLRQTLSAKLLSGPGHLSATQGGLEPPLDPFRCAPV